MKWLFNILKRWLRRFFRKKVQCELCHEPAIVECHWGLYEIKGQKRSIPMREAKLCRFHSRELWKQCSGAVNSGRMHWENKPVNL